jgi:hypothetical protein
LNKGFIKDESLKEKLTSLNKLELEQLLSSVDDIIKCEVINLHFDDKSNNDSLEVNSSNFFNLLENINDEVITSDTFSRIYDNMKVIINDKELELSAWSKINIYQTLHELWAKKYRQYAINYNQNDEYTKNLKGTKRKIDTYYSLQNQFPQIYGIGKQGLLKSEPNERHAKAKQLKAYLLFFEQYLANHLSQLNQVDGFFNNDFNSNTDSKKTYYSQHLSNVPNVEALSPDPIFKLEACIYYSEKENRRLYVEAEIDKEELMYLNSEKKILLLERILLERKLFEDFLLENKDTKIPSELKFGSEEIQSYLEMLYSLKFKWLEDKIEKNFGRSVVLSFAMLMIVEKKHFTPILFAESFRYHLKQMLIASGKGELFQHLFENLKKIKLTKKDDDLCLKRFIKLYESSINDTKEHVFFDRKNRVYDHLLARFGEDLNPTPWNVSRRVDAIKSEEELQNTLLEKKSSYLKNIENLTAEITKAESFVKEVNSEKTARYPSGLEEIIIAKTGVLPRSFRGAENLGAYVNNETFYIVDHILLRSFLINDKPQFGFKFVDPYGEFICGTKLQESWCTKEKDRDMQISHFYEAFCNHTIFKAETKNNSLISNDIYNDEQPSKVLATFSEDYIAKDKVLDLINLFRDLPNKTGQARLREVEKIRAKGLANVKRGEYGQRRLIYQRKLNNFPNKGDVEIIDEDFFNLSISVVVQETSDRFKDKLFKHYLNELIKERVPSHIKVNILWINQKEMKKFQKIYLNWENLKADEIQTLEKFKVASYNVYKKILKFKKK